MFNDSVSLYNYSLQTSQTITHSVFGHFSSSNAQEIVVARGSILELLRHSKETDKLESILSTDVFGMIRDIQLLRLPNVDRDHIVVGSDSGKIVILEYVASLNSFERIHEETFGKTGTRRIVPGEYVACDPQGRAIMIAALEKQKFVYSIGTDSESRVTISSPLECHRNDTLCYSVVGLHTHASEKPLFVSLEANYNDVTTGPDGEIRVSKQLVYYEYDVNLNNVVCVYAEETHHSASSLLAIPGDSSSSLGSKGIHHPGGVLVLCDNRINYHRRGSDVYSIPLPRRYTGLNLSTLISSSNLYLSKNKKIMLVLLQTEHGDLIKVDFTTTFDNISEVVRVDDISASYFDTIPVSTSFVLTDRGLLFAASEIGDAKMYRITSFGDDLESVEHTTWSQHSGLLNKPDTSESMGDEDEEDYNVYFLAKGLTKLDEIFVLPQLSPIVDMVVSDIADELTPQIYTLNGTGANSRLSVLRHGLGVVDISQIPLPGSIGGMWDVKTHHGGEHTRYTVLSFADATMVLSITDTVAEDEHSGLLLNVPTLSVGQGSINIHNTYSCEVSETVIVQTHSKGLHAVVMSENPKDNGDNFSHTFSWQCPISASVTHCVVSGNQCIVALSNSNVLLLDITPNAFVQTASYNNTFEIISLAVSPIEQGKLRSDVVVLISHDNTTKVLSLLPQTPLDLMVVQILPDKPSSVIIVPNSSSTTTSGRVRMSNNYVIHYGFVNGLLYTAHIDTTTGTATAPLKKVLGTRPVTLSIGQINGLPCVYAISGKVWCYYQRSGKFCEKPLSGVLTDYVVNFSKENITDSIISVSGEMLRVQQINDNESIFSTTEVKLQCTGKKLIYYNSNHYFFDQAVRQSQHAIAPMPITNNVVINNYHGSCLITLESTPRTYSHSQREEAYGVIFEATGQEEESEEGSEGPSEAKKQFIAGQIALEENAGMLVSDPTQSMSCISVRHPVTLDIMQTIQLEEGETVLSGRICVFDGKIYLVVGIALNLVQLPKRSHNGGILRVYQLNEATRLVDVEDVDETGELVIRQEEQLDVTFVRYHDTKVNDLPLSIEWYQYEQMVFVGVGNVLRLYSLGSRRLLLKCECRQFTRDITNIKAIDSSSLFVTDSVNGAFMVNYTCNPDTGNLALATSVSAKPVSHIRKLTVVAQPPAPKYTSSMTLIDKNTVAIGDKFGNITISRLLSNVVDLHLTNNAEALMRINAQGQVVKNKDVYMTDIASFYCGDMITCMQKVALFPGGVEVLVVCTIMGAIKVFVPITTREESDFLTNLELHMKTHVPSLVGRSHLQYRSSYVPVSNVIDGDLCDLFVQAYNGASVQTSLNKDRLERIAEDLTERPKEIVRKLHQLKQRVL